MKFVLFCHAITSCWNNGHAHFLRGVARELIASGHEISVCEPETGWSRVNAIAEGGAEALQQAERLVPGLAIYRYAADPHDDEQLDEMLDSADVVLVHEWNEPALVAAIGKRRRRGAFKLLFLDAHHRAVSDPETMEALDLASYDGVLAFGGALREIYRRRGWGARAFTWHEAADVALFRPPEQVDKELDLIWIGNWGDEERSRELNEFLVEPVARLKLRTRVHGVRYPEPAKALLRKSSIQYAGWLPNHRVPEAFARARMTVHIPRQAYTDVLAGIPTIRVFEALACGIPLVCSPWSDEEGLFPAGCYLQTRNGTEMCGAMKQVLGDATIADELSRNGLAAIHRAHTCRHRVHELLAIIGSLSGVARSAIHAERRQMEAVQ